MANNRGYLLGGIFCLPVVVVAVRPDVVDEIDVVNSKPRMCPVVECVIKLATGKWQYYIIVHDH